MIDHLTDRPRILGICASLRSGRWNAGNDELIDQINAIEDEEQLQAFLKEESLAHLANFVAAGRDDGLPFDEIYRNLKREVGRKGLSNSEVGLASALWSAKELGCEIDFVSLVEHFPPSNEHKRIDELKERLRAADGILLATPVYFGDRSSLAHTLIQLIRDDEELATDLEGTVYAGLAVGAKRNGGQETTLIYQIVDMLGLGLLAIGNDSDTTSQYGGTLHAGDVGTAWDDAYGLETSRGTGRRIARVASQLHVAKDIEVDSPLRVGFWVLQERNGFCQDEIRTLLENHANAGGHPIEAHIIDASEASVTRCLACDICPTTVGVDRDYRCIIKKKNDFFRNTHEELLDLDAIIPVAIAPRDRTDLRSMYQQFVERTRYLRRGDYLFTDLLTAPLLFQEIGTNDSLQLRMLTSMMRHHTVLVRPMTGWIHEGEVLLRDQLQSDFERFARESARLTAGRLGVLRDPGSDVSAAVRYNPVGYVLSAEKDKEAETVRLRAEQVADRLARGREAARVRLRVMESSQTR